MPTLLRTLLLCLLAPAVVAVAQNKPVAMAPSQDNPLSTYNKYVYGHVKDILLRSAEKMPEENYNFKPTDTVRSYGQIVGHVADAQYLSSAGELEQIQYPLGHVSLQTTERYLGRKQRIRSATDHVGLEPKP